MDSIVITKEENWFVAQDTITKIASQGKTEADALANLNEALDLFYEDQKVQ